MSVPRSYKDSIITNKNKNIQLLQEKLDKIRNSFQPQQRTKEWYEYRHGLLTASNIGKIIGSTAKKNCLIYETIEYDKDNLSIISKRKSN